MIGVDIDRSAIDLAKILIREHGVRDRISFIVADACRLSFQNKVFDGVISIATFEHTQKLRRR